MAGAESKELLDEAVRARESGDFEGAIELWGRSLQLLDAGHEARPLVAGNLLMTLRDHYAKGYTDEPQSQAIVEQMEALIDDLTDDEKANGLFVVGEVRHDLWDRWHEVEDLVRARSFLAESLVLAAPGWQLAWDANRMITQFSNDLDNYLRDPEDRRAVVDESVAAAREALRIAQGGIARPGAVAQSAYDLAAALRLRAYLNKHTRDDHEAMGVLNTAEQSLDLDSDDDGLRLKVTITNLRGLCWKDLRDESPEALDREIACFTDAVDLVARYGLGHRPSVTRNLAIAMAARALRDGRPADRTRAYELLRASLSNAREGTAIELTVSNWLSIALEDGDLREVVEACEVGIERLGRYAREQRSVQGGASVVFPLVALGTRLAEAYLDLDEPWLAAAAMDRSRALLLEDGEKPELTVAQTVDLIREVSQRRVLCYLIEGESRVHAVVLGVGADPLVITKPLDVAALGQRAAAMYGRLAAWVSEPSETAFDQFDEAVTETGRYLWDLIVGEVVAACPRDHELAVVSSGRFGFLPLVSAHPGNGEPDLLDLVALSLPLTARHLAAAERQQPRDAGGVLLLSSAGTGSSALAAVDDECRAVQAAFASRRAVRRTGEKSVALAHLDDAGVIHAACHAFANPMNPMASTFALDDGQIRASELLVGGVRARLAFLSACSTGMQGTQLPAESMSLASVMHRLGAAAVVSTAWPIIDFAAQAVAVIFYESWLEDGLTPVFALRAAQQRFRRGDLVVGSLSSQYLSDRVEMLQSMGSYAACWAAFAICGA